MRLFLFCSLFSALALFFPSCMPPEEAEATQADKVNVDLRNVRVQRLLDWRDQHRTDSLLRNLNNPDATLRYLAALAFASARDSSAIESLASLLGDRNEDVRIAAAFSLGQIGHKRAEKFLVSAFVATDSTSIHQRFNAIVLEAIGKCGTAPNLRNLAAVSTYRPTDTLLLEGQCRAIYRFGLRNITDSIATARMIEYAGKEIIPESARLMAAHYLARTEKITPDSAQAVQLAAAFVRSVNPNIRMALATALGKSKTGPAFGILSKVINTESDWRVKCNIINAMAKFNYDTVRSLVTPLVGFSNPHVARTAAEFFINNGQAKDGDYYWRIARDRPNLPVQVQIALYRASNRWLSALNEPESKDFVNYRLRELYNQTKDPYERAACLHALSEYGWQFRWIHDKGFNDPNPVVKSAAAEALLSIMKKPNFYSFFGENGRPVRREMYVYLHEIVASGDPGMIAGGVEGFMIPALDYRSMRDSTRMGVLSTARGKLKMPRDVEAAMALDKVMAFFENKPAPPAVKLPFNHPIAWPEIATLRDTAKARIVTSKGTITLELYPHWAPGSVASFLKLASTGFYNGKVFHRVVPNFVIQGGCPRGDGYGAPDYSLRTEIGLVWYDKPGYLGMASAGADTEGSQFFITQSPTPHLDGRYTIFGRVVSGLDVVDKIQVGDKIDRVVID